MKMGRGIKSEEGTRKKVAKELTGQAKDKFFSIFTCLPLFYQFYILGLAGLSFENHY